MSTAKVSIIGKFNPRWYCTVQRCTTLAQQKCHLSGGQLAGYNCIPIEPLGGLDCNYENTNLWRFVFLITTGANPPPSMLYNIVVVGSCSHNLHQILVIECLIFVIAFLWLRTRLIPTSLVFVLFSFFLTFLLL